MERRKDDVLIPRLKLDSLYNPNNPKREATDIPIPAHHISVEAYASLGS